MESFFFFPTGLREYTIPEVATCRFQNYLVLRALYALVMIIFGKEQIYVTIRLTHVKSSHANVTPFFS